MSSQGEKRNNGYFFVKDYKHDQKLRSSFNMLAEKTFGIQFEEWYRQGFWNENYICYSFLWNGEVISNVSFNIILIIIEGKKVRAIQVGTVMTDPAHRRRGLALKLLQQVISDYEVQCDLFFLAADEDAVSLYEKCGFKHYREKKYTVDLEKISVEGSANEFEKHECTNTCLKAVPMSPGRLSKLKAAAVPLSSKLSAVHDEHILMFYYMLMYRDSIYAWHESDNEPEFYSLFEFDDDNVDWLDVFSEKPLTVMQIKKILVALKCKGIKKVHFNFVPDVLVEGIETSDETNGGWMILAHKGVSFPEGAWFPRISRA